MPPQSTSSSLLLCAQRGSILRPRSPARGRTQGGRRPILLRSPEATQPTTSENPITGSAGRRNFRANITRKNCPPRLRAWRNSKPPAPIQHHHRWIQINTDKDCPKPRFSRPGIRSPDTEPKQRSQTGLGALGTTTTRRRAFPSPRLRGSGRGVRTLQDSRLPLDIRSVGLLSPTLSSRG
jgi:hypothetical protein